MDAVGDRIETDLHAAFHSPDAGGAADRADFLRAADRLPGFVAVRAGMCRLAVPPANGVLLDVGCGIGLEAERIAAANPRTTVIGLDHDPDALAMARARCSAPNLRWRDGDLAALDLPAGSVDVVRAERVLMYVPDLDAAIASVASVLVPGGVFAAFELDYGGTLLPPRGRPARWIDELTDCLERSLPQPWAGRLLPETCAAHGLRVDSVVPHGFLVDRPVWTRIVAGTLRAARADGRIGEAEVSDVEAWIAELDGADPDCFRGAFAGVLTVATAPGHDTDHTEGAEP